MADQEIKLKLNGYASGAKKAAAEARIAIGQMNIAISKQSNEINNNIAHSANQYNRSPKTQKSLLRKLSARRGQMAESWSIWPGHRNGQARP